MNNFNELLQLYLPHNYNTKLSEIVNADTIIRSNLFKNHDEEYTIQKVIETPTANICGHHKRKIKELSKLKNLEYIVACHNKFNHVKDIAGIYDLKRLKELWIGYNNINHLTEFSRMIFLEILHMEHNKIDKIFGLNLLTNLKELHLAENNIEIIEGLETLFNLEILNLAGNKIKKVTGLNKNCNLKELYLSVNMIEEIDFIPEKLEKLFLDKNKLKRINLNLPELFVLDIGFNNLATKDININLPELQYLYMNDNNLKDIDLGYLENIRELYLQNNRINKLKGVNNMHFLKIIDLRNNNVKNLGCLDRNPHLKHIVL